MGEEGSEVQGVYGMVLSELLHEGLTCALAAQRFGLLDDTGAYVRCVPAFLWHTGMASTRLGS